MQSFPPTWLVRQLVRRTSFSGTAHPMNDANKKNKKNYWPSMNLSWNCDNFLLLLLLLLLGSTTWRWSAATVWCRRTWRRWRRPTTTARSPSSSTTTTSSSATSSAPTPDRWRRSVNAPAATWSVPHRIMNIYHDFDIIIQTFSFRLCPSQTAPKKRNDKWKRTHPFHFAGGWGETGHPRAQRNTRWPSNPMYSNQRWSILGSASLENHVKLDVLKPELKPVHLKALRIRW